VTAADRPSRVECRDRFPSLTSRQRDKVSHLVRRRDYLQSLPVEDTNHWDRAELAGLVFVLDFMETHQ
jgi:hypothetical protein